MSLLLMNDEKKDIEHGLRISETTHLHWSVACVPDHSGTQAAGRRPAQQGICSWQTCWSLKQLQVEVYDGKEG